MPLRRYDNQGIRGFQRLSPGCQLGSPLGITGPDGLIPKRQWITSQREHYHRIKQRQLIGPVSQSLADAFTLRLIAVTAADNCQLQFLFLFVTNTFLAKVERFLLLF